MSIDNVLDDLDGQILRLTARIERLEEALRPFAEMADTYDPVEDDDDQAAWDKRPTIGDLRRARAAYKGEPNANQGGAS